MNLAKKILIEIAKHFMHYLLGKFDFLTNSPNNGQCLPTPSVPPPEKKI